MSKSLYILLSIVTLFFLSACTTIVKPTSKKPTWLLNQQKLDAFHAVGSSPVNFQGVYMQRNEAINKAKADLAQSIETYITSVYNDSSKVSGDKYNYQSLEKISALSKVILNETYQIDGYFDENKTFYVLLESMKSNNKIKLSTLSKKKFDNKKLLQSRCYSADVLKSIETKSYIHNGKPIWFYRPNKYDTVGSIGIAEKEENIGFVRQKKSALFLAKVSLSKRQQLSIKSQYDILSVLNGEMSGQIFQSSSIVRSLMKVPPSHIQDIWMDPKSCELYIWLVVNH